MIQIGTQDLNLTVDNAQPTLHRDGSYTVTIGQNATITQHNADYLIINPSGNFVNQYSDANKHVPITVKPGDSVILLKNKVGDRSSYWNVPGRSSIGWANAFVFTNWMSSPSVFRPPALGNSVLTRLLRNSGYPENAILPTKLPQIIDLQNIGVDYTGWGAGLPTIDYLVGLLKPFAGDVYSGWASDQFTPDYQHPGYGGYYASIISQALVVLCSSNYIFEQKLPLACAIAQRGLDLMGAYADGRNNNSAEGGHMAGRKAIVVATLHMLGFDPNLANLMGPVYMEDAVFRNQPWWFDTVKWPAGYNYVQNFDTMLKNDPATWGNPEATDPRTVAYGIKHYMPQVVGAQIGTALAMKLFNCTNVMGRYHYDMVRQWMDGPPAEHLQRLNSLGIAVPWGTDYALVKGAGMCAAAWRHYV